MPVAGPPPPQHVLSVRVAVRAAGGCWPGGSTRLTHALRRLLQAHKRFGIAPKWNDKDYDLLSNKYHYGHDDYEAQKRATALDTAAEKFFARNDKNPVTGKFYDANKESDIALEEEQAKLTHGVHQMEIYPPRIKYGPGMAFDLCTHTVKDGELMQLLREKVCSALRLMRHHPCALRAAGPVLALTACGARVVRGCYVLTARMRRRGGAPTVRWRSVSLSSATDRSETPTRSARTVGST